MFLVAEYSGPSDAAVMAELRAAVRALRADLPIEDVGPMTTWVNQRVSRQRFGAWLLGTFAALAVGLAAIGLMTTIGWWVNLRTKELGVRLALGASRSQVGRLVYRQGITLGAAGIVAGCGLAAFATSTSRDPSTASRHWIPGRSQAAPSRCSSFQWPQFTCRSGAPLRSIRSPPCARNRSRRHLCAALPCWNACKRHMAPGCVARLRLSLGPSPRRDRYATTTTIARAAPAMVSRT